MKGTPVVTRMSAESNSFRFLGMGNSPSMKEAVDLLYVSAARSGYQVARNNFAFQNMISEETRYFLYPFLGSCTLTVTADLYAYENLPAKE